MPVSAFGRCGGRGPKGRKKEERNRRMKRRRRKRRRKRKRCNSGNRTGEGKGGLCVTPLVRLDCVESRTFVQKEHRGEGEGDRQDVLW